MPYPYATPTSLDQYKDGSGVVDKNQWNGSGASYDADGNQKTLTGGRTFTYDAAGNLAAEYGAPTDSGTQYVTADALGSTRLTTDSSGTVKKCYDYYPFGEEIAAGVGGRGSCFPTIGYPTSAVDAVNTKFTGQPRDEETEMDLFGARYFSSPQGRFTSPDPLFAKKEWLDDPQRWNRYGYVNNNPLTYTAINAQPLEKVKLAFTDDCWAVIFVLLHGAAPEVLVFVTRRQRLDVDGR